MSSIKYVMLGKQTFSPQKVIGPKVSKSIIYWNKPWKLNFAYKEQWTEYINAGSVVVPCPRDIQRYQFKFKYKKDAERYMRLLSK